MRLLYPRNFASALITFLFAAGVVTSAVPQGRTLEPSVAEVPFARSRDGNREIYIISFGLFGPESVFASEAEKAAHILRERLQPDAQLLVRFNHKRGGIASSATLAKALRSAGQAMDPAKDILVVFLTSHGSPDGLEVVAGPRRETLSPRSFRSMLNASGARYRVIIISACYSGVFARALADPRTLVITAAAPDRPSFGCEDGATWTYFGDAFFNQALRASPTLDAAFCRAREIVTKRERREGFAPSRPQMAGGSEVLPLLGSPVPVPYPSCRGTSAAPRQHRWARSRSSQRRLPWIVVAQPRAVGQGRTAANTPEPSSLETSAPVVQPGAAEPANSTACEPERIDINTASADDLNRLGGGIGKAIMAGRPYRSVDELVSKRVLKRSTFNQIKDRITASTAPRPVAPTPSVVQSVTNPQSEGAAAREVTRGEVTCAGLASYSAAAGPDVVVTRRGYLDEVNPLTPATHVKRLQVLQVSIAGKTATAYGPGFQALRRGPGPDQLEQTMDAAVAWEQALGTLPSTMIILAEEGPEVVAKLRFKTCTAAARSKPPSRSEPKTGDSQEGQEAPPPKALPRGAIQ
jgi:hypothetical protein